MKLVYVFTFVILNNNIYTLSALRHCVSAGEPLNPEVMDSWKRATGLSIREGYGQTEMTISCGMFRCLDIKPGSMGKAMPGYDIQVYFSWSLISVFGYDSIARLNSTSLLLD